MSPFDVHAMPTTVKILIVDDNASMRATIRKVVARDGDDFDECDDGRYAVEAYRRFQPDWVLMDINMKGMNGIEAAGRIVAEHPGARIVMVTDHGDRSFRKAAAKAGACGFVMKESLGEIDHIIRVRP